MDTSFDGYYVVHRRIGTTNRTYYAINQRGMRMSIRMKSYTTADATAVQWNMRDGYNVAEGRAHTQELDDE